MRFNICRDDGPGGYNHASAHRYARQNQNIHTNPCPIADADGFAYDIRGATLAAKANLMCPSVNHDTGRKCYVFPDMAFAIEDKLNIRRNTRTLTNRQAFVPRTAMATQNQRTKNGDLPGDVKTCKPVQRSTDTWKSPLRNQPSKKATNATKWDKVADSDFVTDEI